MFEVSRPWKFQIPPLWTAPWEFVVSSGIDGDVICYWPLDLLWYGDIYTYICIYMSGPTCTCIRICTESSFILHADIGICMFVCIYTYTCISISMYLPISSLYVDVYVYIYIYIYTPTYIYIYNNIYTNIYLCMNIFLLLYLFI